MPRDTSGATTPATPPREQGETAFARKGESRRGLGLSGKLLLLTLLFVMLAEVLIFLPSVANFRHKWLMDRLSAARLASLATAAAPEASVPRWLQDELLRTAQVKAIAVKRENQRQLILDDAMPGPVSQAFDLRDKIQLSWSGALYARLKLIWDAVAVFLSSGDRLILVSGQPEMRGMEFVEIVLPEAPLRADMIKFALNILGLSIIISLFTASLVYFALNRLLVRPIQNLSEGMSRFRERPEDPERIIIPSSRSDEVGAAERELAAMQRELNQTLHQKTRLAALGLAVSKINHDLRNMLSTAQLMSDRLGTVSDPTVQQFAPKLLASLDRAIRLCNDTLRYGRTEEAAPRRERFALAPFVEEISAGLGFPREDGPRLEIVVPGDLLVDADPEQLYRVLSNLARNAVQAIESAPGGERGTVRIGARREGALVRLEIADTGPGIPAGVRANLFKPFQSFERRDGSGLGLAIAHELVTAHGGSVRLADARSGTRFEVVIPDRRGNDAQ